MIRRLRTCLVVAALCGVAGVLDRPAYGQRATACDCPDVFDLINRLNMAEAAISALQGELREIEAADRKAGKPSSMLDRHPAGGTNQDVLRSAINGAMSGVQLLGGQTSQGETDGRCASSIVASSTKCMDEIVMFHENTVHVPACTKDRGAGRTTLLGFRAAQTTADYVREEMAGYQAEIDRIRSFLRLLSDSCRPDGWVGMISYFEERTLNATETVSTGGTFAATNTHETMSTLKKDVRILFRETGTSRGNTHLKEQITRRDIASARTSCTAGPPDRTSTGTSDESIDIDGIGEDDVSADFQLDELTGKITLAFDIPGVVATATANRFESTRGSCNPADDGSRISPSTSYPLPYETSNLVVEGVAAREPNVIRGSKTIDLTQGVSIPNASVSHQARVSWAFYRVN